MANPCEQVGSARVRGRVLGPDGKLLRDFSVAVLNSAPPHSRWAEAGTVVRDSLDGVFECGGLSEGERVVLVTAVEFANGVSQPFLAVAGKTTPCVEVHMSAGGSVAGCVLDAYNGAPVLGATVSALEEFDVAPLVPLPPLWPLARTDRNGRFLLERVSAGNHRLEIQARGYATVRMSDVNVEEDRPTEVPPWQLLAGATITGVARGANGPAANAEIILTPIDSWPHRRTRATDTGRYVIQNVLPGPYMLAGWRSSASTDPFDVIRDLRHSEIEISVADRAHLELDMDLGPARR